MRSAPGRLSDISKEVEHGQSAESGASASDGTDEEGHGNVAEKRRTKGTGARDVATSPEEEKVSQLRDAMNARLSFQSRTRRSQGNNQTEIGTNRVSPIQEEEVNSASPSLAATLASHPAAVRTNSTQSAESTESTESSKTIRASQPNTPAANQPLRTPSYPFPYVPGNSKSWSSSFHQPFTALSPTITGQPANGDDTPGKNSGMFSEGSTPAQNPSAFMPPGTVFQTPEDPRFPTPNLYNLVLQLNAEPGLEQWWATVTNIMHDHYKAERVSLVMPMDPTDIENVPWGQKATFSMNGPEEFVPHLTVLEQTSHATAFVRPDLAVGEPSNDASDVKPQKLHAERLRPRLDARHSYAGHGREVYNEGSSKPSARPTGPQRTVTHASGVPGRVGSARLPPRRFPSTSTIRHGSLSDPAFSSIAGGVDAGPYAEVFSSLRSLDHEVRPLIEPGGVNRVLDRGRVVTVTRDYVPESSDAKDDRQPGATPGQAETPEPPPTAVRQLETERIFGNYRSVFSSDNAPSQLRDYEEYEQHPTSPWSQSPAPSPAIQSDEEENPFFASGEQQVEDSFNPATTPKDYTQLGQVEAIGVDQANTVIHIPLVHPTMSQPMQSLRTYPKSSRTHDPPQRSNTIDMERKTPIAILSVLSSAVPYPHNLTQSLKLLGPHLATSFATSQQFSSTHLQALTIRQRKAPPGEGFNAPMTIEPTSLADIVNAEIDEPLGSASGSATSPSEYSTRSKHSPSSSLVGTPGWDPATHGWTASKLMSGTPGMTGTDIIDNYFDAKKRTGQRNGSTAGAHAQGTPARPPRKAPSSEVKADEDFKKSHNDQTSRGSSTVRDDRAPLRSVADKDSALRSSAGVTFSQRPPLRQAISHSGESGVDRQHSQLHSYGADFHASFGTLPSPSLEPRTQGGFRHGRKSSYSEDMPPPSERLLRTIIDSVPVQIFTAEPETGKLTWVNSKFLIYRGQEARQVLSEPWQAIHPDDRREFMSTWQRSLRTAQQLQQKVRLQRFDGSYRWFYVRSAPLKDKRQKIVHWIGTMMDFHEQHVAEMNLSRQQETAASEAKYRALANSSPQIVFAVNRTKGVTFCNTRWFHFSGQPEAQALGVGFMDHVHPDDLTKCRLPTFDEDSDNAKNVPTSMPPELTRKPSESTTNTSSETEKGVASTESSPLNAQMPQRKLSELASTGILKIARDADGRPSYSTEVRLKSKDGDYRWHLVRVLLAEPLLQSEHEEETWYGTCTDINDHKTLERDLKETMDEKSRFLSNMSHEIRTPLNGITGMVNFLIDSSLTTEQLEHVNVIRSSAEGLRGLINDILDLSKAEAGMIQLNMDWFFVRALIEEVNDLTSAMAIDKGLELNYLVHEDVPGQIKGDRFRIRQVLLNIIGNAIKFTQKGEVFVRCSTHQTGLGEPIDELFIKFDIVDSGQGFTEKEAEVLFKRFSQIDGSSTRQHGGTGLGLVISRQLVQLHGGDMSAKGLPGKGSTFTFFIKTTVASAEDQPPPPPTPTPGFSIPMLPILPGPAPSTTSMSKLTKTPSIPFPFDGQAKPSPKFLVEHTESPSPYDAGRESPSVSSASSDPSVRSNARTASLRSERSSASSYVPEPSGPMKLALPEDPLSRSSSAGSLSTDSSETIRGLSPSAAAGGVVPPMYSILVVSPLRYTREATVHHIDMTLPSNIPHQITALENLSECQKMMGGEDPVIFTHIVAVLPDVDEIVALMQQVLSAPPHQTTEMVVITDLAQRRKIMELAPKYNYDALAAQRRLRFVFKPLKPSRFAIIFDPGKEREMSTDRNQDSAQQVALTQKQVFEELTGRLGNKGKRVLLVEDNRTNQMVVQKFLKKVSIPGETASDGVECTDKVFSHPCGYYSIILCDLHMPNKDGYQTCKDVREWERQNKFPHIPIIALSANVLGDVYQKCVESGFNSYMTKPVDFKELSTALMTFLDPRDPNKPHEFMREKRRKSLAPGR
ncbi:hypothetical protein LTR37_005383 [Vermiconidia calcicola]|uniref:Uncharacterized protein n=1 Tax=Vermiconidia calcicola TaxID=1690605 RepID=A0ACC3NKH6_9PEZI|nr:hypothetical protein LTR37_005383 [Vermiconidia calcicola]